MNRDYIGMQRQYEHVGASREGHEEYTIVTRSVKQAARRPVVCSLVLLLPVLRAVDIATNHSLNQQCIYHMLDLDRLSGRRCS